MTSGIIYQHVDHFTPNDGHKRTIAHESRKNSYSRRGRLNLMRSICFKNQCLHKCSLLEKTKHNTDTSSNATMRCTSNSVERRKQLLIIQSIEW